MGSACCTAAKDRSLPSGSRGETVHRNAMYSPSWSFQWDSRRRVASDFENLSYGLSPGPSGESSMELKRELGIDKGSFSGGGSSYKNSGSPMSMKVSNCEGLAANPVTPPSDQQKADNNTIEAQSSVEFPEIVKASSPKLSLSVPSTSSSLTPTDLPTQCRSPLSNPTPSRQTLFSPRNRLLRQISDSRTMGLKSPSSQSVSERTPSFVLSTCSNDLIGGSSCGSSDGWSMRTFSELVASSQRGRWSFDSEFLGSGPDRTRESSSRFLLSPSVDVQTCGACSKLLTERSSWSGNELPVVAVLICGHVYHTECLETMTLGTDRYDPSCPICLTGERQMSKMSRKASRNGVVGGHPDAGFDVLKCQKSVENPKREVSSRSGSSSAKPFLRRHFSIGTKWSRSLSENESARKKGFWGRHRKS